MVSTEVETKKVDVSKVLSLRVIKIFLSNDVDGAILQSSQLF